MHGITNLTLPVRYEPRFSLVPMALICLVLGGIIVWTIVGNVLVLVTIILELKINSSSNHLIFSLAITDLLVAIAVMPLSIIKEVSIRWWLGVILCDIWIFVDVLSCTASIFHLVVIAIDRYLSITKISYNRNRSLRSTSIMIASSWIASIVVSVPSRFYFQRKNDMEIITVEFNGTCIINQGDSYTILANFLSFCFPLLVIVFIYIKIFIFIMKQTKSRRSIMNSAIGSDALTMALTNDYSISPCHDAWDANETNIIQDENSFETGFTESLEQSSWIEEVLPTLSYADEEEDDQTPSFRSSPDDMSTKLLISFDKSSLNSFHHSSNCQCCQSSSEFTRPHHMAEQEKVTSDEDDQTLGKVQLQTFSSGKSIIKSPTSNSNKLRSPTLSWSPKLTFYSYRKANINHISAAPSLQGCLEPITSSAQFLKSPTSSTECHSPTFISVANRTKRLNQKREFRVARTLFILTGFFIICWMPFAVNNLLRAYVFVRTTEVNNVLDSVFLWLGYLNSGLNPIIYTVFSPDFQSAFKKIICGNNLEI